MTFVFLILDFNTFYFYGGPPWKLRIYVTGASALKIVTIIIIIIIIIFIVIVIVIIIVIVIKKENS